MLISVRLTGKLLPEETWLNLGIQTAVGIAVYAAVCLLWWKLSGKDHLKVLLGHSPAG